MFRYSRSVNRYAEPAGYAGAPSGVVCCFRTSSMRTYSPFWWSAGEVVRAGRPSSGRRALGLLPGGQDVELHPVPLLGQFLIRVAGETLLGLAGEKLRRLR